MYECKIKYLSCNIDLFGPIFLFIKFLCCPLPCKLTLGNFFFIHEIFFILPKSHCGYSTVKTFILWLASHITVNHYVILGGLVSFLEIVVAAQNSVWNCILSIQKTMRNWKNCICFKDYLEEVLQNVHGFFHNSSLK